MLTEVVQNYYTQTVPTKPQNRWWSLPAIPFLDFTNIHDYQDLKLERFLVRYKVNGTSLLGATHLEAVRSLRGIGEDLSLLVCDGFDPSQVPAGQSWMASPVASINSGSGRTQSEESLDREPLVPTSERAYDDIKKEIRRQVG